MLLAALWVSGLLACLCLVALGAALGGRSGKRWKATSLAIAAAAAPLALSVGAVVATARLRAIGSEASWVAYALTWGGAFTIGAAAILLLALRRRADGWLGSASWRRLVLLGGSLLGAVGFFLALERMDASVRADMESRLRVLEKEAAALSERPPVPDAENAAPHYVRAFEIIQHLGITGDFAEEVFEPAFDIAAWKSSETGEATARREEAVRAILDAAALPHMSEEVDPNTFRSFVGERHTLHFRDAGVLLALDARMRASSGDLTGAFSSAAALWRLSGHALEAGGNIRHFLVACALSERASQTIENLLAILGDRDPPSSAGPPYDLVHYSRAAREIERERLQVLCFLLKLFREQPEGPMVELPGVDRLVWIGPEIGYLIQRPYLALYRRFVLPGDLASFESRVEELIRLAGRPPPEARPGLIELEADLGQRPGGLFTGMFMSTLLRLPLFVARADARLVLARAGLAAATYRARHGAYPSRLDDLVPDFLAAVPIDPFDGKPIKLAPVEGGLVLYSVSEDGIDDGGAELEEPARRKGDLAFRLGSAYAAHARAAAARLSEG